MKPLIEHLATYASYHRDSRNIMTHFFGVPLILFAIVILLARPQLLEIGPITLSPALVASTLVAIFYIRLHRSLGLLMATVLAVFCAIAQILTDLPFSLWLTIGLGIFIGGWIIQAIGHIYEGRKPAFFDDLIGLIIGPLFVMTELLIRLGAYQDLAREVEHRAGPVRLGMRK